MTLKKLLALIAASAGIGLSFSVIAAFSWDGPTGTPPAGNVSAPINVGSVFQDKAGAAWFDGGIGIDSGSAFCIGASCITAWPGLSQSEALPLYATVLNTTLPNATSTFAGHLLVTGTATSTFYNGINLTKGCFAIKGVCISQQQQLLDVQCVAVYGAPSYIYCVRISDGVVIAKQSRTPWNQISNGEGWPGGSSWQCSGGIILFCVRVTDGVAFVFDGRVWSYDNGDGWIF
jgi:hypothetical protein